MPYIDPGRHYCNAPSSSTTPCAQADAIVATARKWIGTRFTHQGRVRATDTHRGGCDCLGLIIGVAQELNLTTTRGDTCVLLASCDRRDYGHNPERYVLEEALCTWLERIPAAVMAPGDVALFCLESTPQHVGIVSDYRIQDTASAHRQHTHCPYPSGHRNLGLIHAYAQARKTVEHHFNDWWRARLVGAFRFAATQ